jgi:hypothetical protein
MIRGEKSHETMIKVNLAYYNWFLFFIFKRWCVTEEGPLGRVALSVRRFVTCRRRWTIEMCACHGIAVYEFSCPLSLNCPFVVAAAVVVVSTRYLKSELRRAVTDIYSFRWRRSWFLVTGH